MSWDEGVRWREYLRTPPASLPATVAFVRDKVLRVTNGDVEDDYIESLIAAATSAAEHDTGRALMPQARELVLNRFPCGRIVLPRLPLIAVDEIAYVDLDGAEQVLTGSPEEFRTVPSSDWTRGEVWPLHNAIWPATRCQEDAVRVRYRAGYDSASERFDLIVAGIGLMVGELYKQRSLSVHAVHNTPSVLALRRFWEPVR